MKLTCLQRFFVCSVALTVYVSAASDCNNIDKTDLPSDTCAFDLRMKNARPTRADQYLCSGYSVSEDILPVVPGQATDKGYIVKFEALADAGTAHHILVFGCEKAYRKSGSWSCGTVCEGEEQIIFAWAKNAPPLSLPKDVGRRIGKDSLINHIVIQIHYAKPLDQQDNSGIRIYTTYQRQQYLAGIYLLLAFKTVIPPESKKVHADISCVFNWPDSIVPFGFRTHAHSLGQVISGYKVEGNDVEMIGKGNPQWPQAFYPVQNHIEIKPGDILAARCTYSSEGRHTKTYIGASATDEMCNFYIMYYTNATSEGQGPDTCAGNHQKQVFRVIPTDSDTPLPPNPDLEDEAKGHVHHHHAMPGDNAEAEQHQDRTNQKSGTISNSLNSVGDRRGDFDDNFGKRVGTKYRVNPSGGSGSRGMLSQGKSRLSTSFGNDALEDAGFLRGRQMSDVGRPQSYLFDLDYPVNDYYDIMQERSRNKVKKPYYDLYGLPKMQYGYTDLSDDRNTFDKSFPTLSRNRNKDFNAKYDDYAASQLLRNDGLGYGSMGSNSGQPSKGGNQKSAQGPKSGGKGSVGSSKSKKDGAVKPADSTLGLTFKSALGNFKLGQVAGLDVGKNGEVYIFHRGSRVWDSLSFDMQGNYQYREDPVATDPIVVVDRDGKVIRSLGKNRFYLPHGLTLDDKENVWVTDVALHQVFRLPKGQEEPDLTLGIKWEPGSDKEHFCKPADVAVLSSGEFYVADGYCNNRIMKFDRNGYFLQMWGEATTSSKGLDSYPLPGMFSIPHSLALAEEKNLLCVADRENGRIQCFNLNGTFIRQMHPKQVGETLYAVEYCPNHGGILFAVNGPSLSQEAPDIQGLTFDINTGVLLSTWNIPDKGLTHPHDVTVDTGKHLVYVGELNPTKVWKFEMTQALYTANNSASGGSDTGAVKSTAAPVVTDANVDSAAAQKTKLEEKEDFAPSLVIGMLLVVPVIILVAVTVLIRLYHTGYFRKCASRSQRNYKFNLGNFLNSHKGFDRLSTEDDDHDIDNALDDSDNEEFSIVRKA